MQPRAACYFLFVNLLKFYSLIIFFSLAPTCNIKIIKVIQEKTQNHKKKGRSHSLSQMEFEKPPLKVKEELHITMYMLCSRNHIV